MKKISRRNFLESTIGLAVLGSSALTITAVQAGGHAKLDPEDAQAKALSYVHASPKADANCANCQLYTGSVDAEWGPCAIFPGKEVAAAGWCSAWVKKSG